MVDFSRRHFAVGVAALAACGRVRDEARSDMPKDGGTLDRTAPTDHVQPIDAAPPPLACVIPQRDYEGVFTDRPARKTLYTWTTKEQADALVSVPTLYSKMEGVGGKGFLFDLLEKRAAGGDATAKSLSQPDFMTGRFAWPIPWGTITLCERYGYELVRIDLSPDARFIVIADTQAGTPYQAVAMDNSPVPLATALSEPERIAGIFFTNDSCGGCGSWGGARGYREFHLCHESTVVEWSLRTPTILAELQKGIDFLTSIREVFDACVSRVTCDQLLALWRSPAANDDVERLLACLAFGWGGNASFLFDHLATARFTPAPFVHRPNG